MPRNYRVRLFLIERIARALPRSIICNNKKRKKEGDAILKNKNFGNTSTLNQLSFKVLLSQKSEFDGPILDTKFLRQRQSSIVLRKKFALTLSRSTHISDIVYFTILLTNSSKSVFVFYKTDPNFADKSIHFTLHIRSRKMCFNN